MNQFQVFLIRTRTNEKVIYMDKEKIIDTLVYDSKGILLLIAIVGVFVRIFVIKPSMANEIQQLIFLVTFFLTFGVIKSYASFRRKRNSQ